MRNMMISLAAMALMGSGTLAQTPTFKTVQLSDKFYCEGAHYGDFNKDGKMDVVSGPYWYEGPDFQRKHEIHTPKAYDPLQYSENFLSYVYDFNSDGWADVLHVGFPAKESYWYENPAGKDGPWKKHLMHTNVGGESPVFGDVTGDGKPELLFCAGDQYGYAKATWAKPDETWTFVPVTPKGGFPQFSHGQGFGDINGDGKMDLLELNAWWEQPKTLEEGKPWIKHPFKFADAAAQLLAYDVDGDGLTDVVTAWHCHLYGINWYRQVRSASGEITFEKHVIIGQKPEENSQGLRFSQAHAFAVADFNGDGLMDFVTGKRFWSHGPKGDIEPDAPAVVYWFELKRDKEKGAHFVAHQVHDNSGVGTQVAATDLNGDGVPDIIVGNKKGTFISLSQK